VVTTCRNSGWPNLPEVQLGKERSLALEASTELQKLKDLLDRFSTVLLDTI
jgi:hypothetical protein